MDASNEELEVQRVEAESGIPDLYGCAGWTLIAVLVLALIAAGLLFLVLLSGPPVNL